MPADCITVRSLAHCTGCGACVPVCPTRALSLESEQPDGRGRKTVVVASLCCTGCGACLPACPRQALVMDHRPSGPGHDVASR